MAELSNDRIMRETAALPVAGSVNPERSAITDCGDKLWILKRGLRADDSPQEEGKTGDFIFEVLLHSPCKQSLLAGYRGCHSLGWSKVTACRDGFATRYSPLTTSILNSPLTTSTCTVASEAKSPLMISRAIGVSRPLWMWRLSGRAP